MSLRVLLRTLTPMGRGAVVVVLILVLLMVGRGLGVRWDPFDFGGRRLERAERQAEVAAADAGARRLEVEGAVAQTRRLEQQHQQSVELARITAAAQAEARNAHDSDLPLDPDRAARLRDHDRRLCRLAPAVCAAAPAGLAASGADALSTGSTADQADPG